jgi:3-oxoacyl-[acyl-carrier-protein] synthase-3
MRWDRLLVSGTAVSLPDQVSISDAVKDGRYPRELADATGQIAVTVAEPDTNPLALAVHAARRALDVSGVDPDAVALLMHTSGIDQAIPGASSTGYIQAQLGIGNRCRPSEFMYSSSAPFGSLELAMSWLGTYPVHDHPAPRPVAVITASATWPPLLLHRWTASETLPFGDAGAALVLGTDDGWAQLMSIVTRSNPWAEATLRGSERFGPVPYRRIVSFEDRRREWLRNDLSAALSGIKLVGAIQQRKTDLREKHAAMLRACVTAALAEAQVKISDINRFVLPPIGADLLHGHYLPTLDIQETRTTWDGPGRRTGRTGPADTIIGLDYLRVKGIVAPGDLVCFISETTGTAMTCGVARVLK